MNKKTTVDKFFDMQIDEKWVEDTGDPLDELFDLLENIADDIIDGFQENSKIMGSAAIVSSHMGMRCKNLLHKIQSALDDRLSAIKISNEKTILN